MYNTTQTTPPLVCCTRQACGHFFLLQNSCNSHNTLHQHSQNSKAKCVEGSFALRACAGPKPVIRNRQVRAELSRSAARTRVQFQWMSPNCCCAESSLEGRSSSERPVRPCITIGGVKNQENSHMWPHLRPSSEQFTKFCSQQTQVFQRPWEDLDSWMREVLSNSTANSELVRIYVTLWRSLGVVHS